MIFELIAAVIEIAVLGVTPCDFCAAHVAYDLCDGTPGPDGKCPELS